MMPQLRALPLILLLLLPLLLPLTAFADDEVAAPAPMRVLFVGNSYTSVNNLPGMIQALATAAKENRAFEYVTSTPGGWTFQQHLFDSRTKTPTRIAQQTWDFVVLQEQSQLPFLYPKTMLQHGTALGELVKAQKSTPLLYMTWAREHQPENQAAITKAYTDLATALDAPVAPVGLAWEAARKERPQLSLYNKDKSHPAPAGSYLAACVFYATIYEKSPVGLPSKLVIKTNDKERTLAQLTDEDAKLLQAVAWKTVQGMKERQIGQ